MTGPRYLVLSDAHFGTPESSINDPGVAKALTDYIAAKAPWEEIVLTGDLLDVNLSTFTRSIEGGSYKDVPRPLIGFRQFLNTLHVKAGAGSTGRGLPDIARRWVYIPGNHDYKVWDMLATKVVCEDVLAAGHPMGFIPTPLKEYAWRGDESFFAGIFRQFGAHAQVVVTYPNYIVSLGNQETMVLTHGHYLDPSQTRGNELSDELGKSASNELPGAVRRIVIETAQYQTVANAVSFTRSTRRLVSDVVGPDGLMNRVRRALTRVGGWVLRLLFPTEGVRGRRLATRQLRSIETYLQHFCTSPLQPRWFVFGHTHRQDAGRTPTLGIGVYNVGSFYPDRGKPITFLEFVVGADGSPKVDLMCVDSAFTVRPTREE